MLAFTQCSGLLKYLSTICKKHGLENIAQRWIFGTRSKRVQNFFWSKLANLRVNLQLTTKQPKRNLKIFLTPSEFKIMKTAIVFAFMSKKATTFKSGSSDLFRVVLKISSDDKL